MQNYINNGAYFLIKRIGKSKLRKHFVVRDESKKQKTIKVIKIESIDGFTPNKLETAIKEVKCLAQLKHPYIVSPHDFIVDHEAFYIINEYCEESDLANYIMKQKEKGMQTDQTLAIKWLTQLLSGVFYLHSRGYLHGNIQTKNIFIKNGALKLGNFPIPTFEQSTNQQGFGSKSYYVSPEVLRLNDYTDKSEMWSIGIVLFEMCSHERAFDDLDSISLMWKIVKGTTPLLSEIWPHPFHHICSQLLAKNPLHRPSAGQLLKDPFLQKQLNKMLNELEPVLTNRISIEKALKRVSNQFIEDDAKCVAKTDKMDEFRRTDLEDNVDVHQKSGLHVSGTSSFEESTSENAVYPEFPFKLKSSQMARRPPLDGDILINRSRLRAFGESDKMPKQEAFLRSSVNFETDFRLACILAGGHKIKSVEDTLSYSKRREIMKTSLRALVGTETEDEETEGDQQHAIFDALYEPITYKEANFITNPHSLEWPQSNLERRLPGFPKLLEDASEEEIEEEEEVDEVNKKEEDEGGEKIEATTERRAVGKLTDAEKEFIGIKSTLMRLHGESKEMLHQNETSLDKTEMSAFDRRTKEIEGIQRQCIEKLGSKNFEAGINSIHNLRLKDSPPSEEMTILKGLQSVCQSREVVFLLDKLVFLNHFQN